MSRFSRRAAAALSALLMAGTLTACGSTSSSDDDASGGPWSYTSGNGETVKLDTTPSGSSPARAEAAGLLAYGIRPVGIYVARTGRRRREPQNLDLTGIEIVGETWGEIDVEKVANLNPDLIVADWWPAEKAYQGFEEGVKASSKKLAKTSPRSSASRRASRSPKLAEGYEGFAESWASTSTDPEIAADKKAFEDAVADFKKAVAAKPGLTVARRLTGRRRALCRRPEVRARAARLPALGPRRDRPRHPDRASPTGRTSRGRTPTSTSPTCC